jgi:hypothetical protein
MAAEEMRLIFCYRGIAVYPLGAVLSACFGPSRGDGAHSKLHLPQCFGGVRIHFNTDYWV